MITLLYPLSKLNIDQSAEIFWLSDHKPVSMRLLDLGFEPGTRVTCVLKRGKDELSAFLVKGTVIALRREDAEIVLVSEPSGMPVSAADIPSCKKNAADSGKNRLTEGDCL